MSILIKINAKYDACTPCQTEILHVGFTVALECTPSIRQLLYPNIMCNNNLKSEKLYGC